MTDQVEISKSVPPPGSQYVRLPTGVPRCRCPNLSIDMKGNWWCCNDPTTRAIAAEPAKVGGDARAGSDGDGLVLHAPRMADGANDDETTGAANRVD